MLQPKRTKFRKMQGKNERSGSKGSNLDFGSPVLSIRRMLDDIKAN